MNKPKSLIPLTSDVVKYWTLTVPQSMLLHHEIKAQDYQLQKNKVY